jgi:ubiquinone/menaquinone biosynthesis C-methylase UbiE
MERQTKKYFKYDNQFAYTYCRHADFDQLYNFFLDTFLSIHCAPAGSLIDLCCGTGDIPGKFKSKFPNLSVTGYDESTEMISFADYFDVTFVNKPISAIDGVFDNIISNNSYHHFDDPTAFWNVINRISHDGTKILISDVIRPDNESDVQKIVEDVLGKNSIFKEAFTLSLTSSYTESELKEQIGKLNLVIVDTPIQNYKLFFVHN